MLRGINLGPNRRVPMADLRARKKSLPVVAALNAGNGAAGRLAELYHRAAPLDDADLRTFRAEQQRRRRQS